MAEGLGNAEIAERLQISEKTVRNHASNIFDKLGVWSRAQAIVFARDRGYQRLTGPRMLVSTAALRQYAAPGPTSCGSVAAIMSHSTVAPASLPPHVQIIQMGTAYWVSQFVCTAANMRLADHLADGPRSASELAAVTGANPRAMHRFMRTLASLGMLAQDSGDRFALTPLGAA